MATLTEQIEAINADPNLNPAQKRKAIYALKCDNIEQAVQQYIGQTYTHQGVAYTLIRFASEEVPTVDGDTIKLLEVVLRAVQATGPNSGTVLISPVDTWRFVNPPILDAQGQEDLVAAAQEMLAGILASQNGGG